MAFLLMTAAFAPWTLARRVRDDVWASVLQWRGGSPSSSRGRPALASLLILFVRSLESFEVPALLGLPVGIQVYTSSIYQAIQQYPSQVGLAAATRSRCC